MKLAFFGYPHLGGTFTVFRHLRAGLATSGHELRWIGMGPAAHLALRDPAWATERETGAACGLPGDDEPAQARALLAMVVEQEFDGVFINVQADRVQTNIARHLSPSILRIVVAHSISPATYAAASAIRAHAHAVVGVSSRIRDDLIAHHGFDPARTHAIHNAVEIPDLPPRIPRSAGGPLRVLSLGRIEDQAKGVLWLPDILRRLPGDTTLTVAGDGPDLARLRQAASSLGTRIRFLGAVAPSEIPTLMAKHDVFVAPSRFEGFMITLAEAMAAGCVPVASRIRGVTDAIVDDGATGLLFPVGDVAAAAAAIERLRTVPALLQAMSNKGPAAMRERFSVGRMGERYAMLLRAVQGDPPSIAAPLPIETWRMPHGLSDGLRTRLPTPLKNFLRGIRERVA